MIKGTRIIEDDDAKAYGDLCQSFRVQMDSLGFNEIIVPSLAEQKLFSDQAGNEILNQMYTFKDRGDRDICLIPEVTAVLKEQWKESWIKYKKRPHKVFYIQRCYRYERPQKGRYREFTQAGVEIFGEDVDASLAKDSLRVFLDSLKIDYRFDDLVKRGLSYYTEDGFEAVCESLGAQKQVAGGGRYEGGIGWAVGVDRLLLAMKT